MSSCQESNDGQYWYIILVVAIAIILIVILVMCLTRESSKTVEEECKCAEYPSVAENISCDPNVVEVNLTASDNEVQILSGDATKLYNYNKSFPGPLIEAKKGDELVVHFFNDICEPTTITWHGLMTPANMDGSSISQFPVQPGDSFDYKFKLNNAGLYWYHSDVNSREQVQKGLYGVILVKDHDEDECYSLPRTDKILAFSDLKLDSSNQVDIDFSTEPCERVSQQVNGILGNVLLTNGVYNGCITLTKDVPVRLYLLNCATDRFMKITLEGHDMIRIGGDQGLLEKPILIKEDNGLVLTTGERAEVVFVPRYDNIRLYTSNPRGIQKVEKDECGNCELIDVEKCDEKELLVTFKVIDEHCDEEQLEVPLELKKIKKIKVDHCTPVIPVYYGNYEPDCDGNIDFFAYRECREGIPFDSLSRKDAPIVIEDGTYIIEITNTSDLANNFYLHGFTFQHLDTLYISEDDKDRQINKVLENKDTIYIPAKPCGDRSKTVVRLAVRFSSKGRDIVAYGKEPTECRSGGWIFTSSMLTRSNLGQAGFVQIIAECDRKNYSSYSGYLNSYSSYSSGDYSSCLTKPSYSKSSKSVIRDSGSNNHLSYSLEKLTKSLITCSCGSGMSVSLCSCSSYDRSSSGSSRRSSYDSYGSSSYDSSRRSSYDSSRRSSYDSSGSSRRSSYDSSSCDKSRRNLSYDDSLSYSSYKPY